MAMATEQRDLSDGDYVMGLALLAAHRSKDNKTQVGACLLNKDNKIVGIGYNGLPLGFSDDDGGWEDKDSYVCHAELNAMLFKTAISLEDCVLYVTLFPCNNCAKAIVQSGIKQIYYLSDKNRGKPYFAPSETMLTRANVKYERYGSHPDSQLSELVINFEEPFPDPGTREAENAGN